MVHAQHDSTEYVPPPVEILEEVDDALLEDKEATTVKILRNGVSYDENLEQRHFNENFQQNYATPEFDYTLTKPRESLWSKIKRKLSEFLSRFIHTGDAKTLNNITLWILRIIAVGIVALVLYWLIRFLLKKEGAWFFSKKNKEVLPEARTIAENIHEIDFTSMINQYELEKNYRFAVRYQYLQTLKELTDKGLIEWDEDKTNLDYIHEIKNDSLRKDFIQLTLIFDYVWYGEFPVNEDNYINFKEQFNQFRKMS